MNKLRVFFTLGFAIWLVALCGNISTAFNVANNALSNEDGMLNAQGGFNIKSLEESVQWMWNAEWIVHPSHQSKYTNVVSTIGRSCVEQRSQVLADLGFTIVDNLFSPNNDVINLLFWLIDFLLLGAFIILGVILYVEHDIILISEIIWIESALLIGKALTQVLTIIPDSNLHRPICCNSTFKTLGWWIFGRIHFDYCGDMLYSGHTFHIVLLILVIKRVMNSHTYSPFAHLLRKFLSTIFLTIFISILLLIRIHYSVDIMLAATLTICLFSHRAFLDIGNQWFQVKTK